MAFIYQTIGVLVLTLGAGNFTHADEIRVAAAASVQDAMKEITDRFQAETGHRVKLTIGSSGNLARQILRGAPFDLFLSADGAHISLLQERALTRGEGADYAVGRLVLFVPTRSAVALDGRLADLAPAARAGQLKRLAIANPEHAPYGAVAREALQNAGVWDALKPYLVTGKDAAQATQFAVTGSVDAAIIPASLASMGAVAQAGRSVPVSESLYTPWRQRMSVLSNAPLAAEELFDFVLSAEAGTILEHHGFSRASPVAAPVDAIR